MTVAEWTTAYLLQFGLAQATRPSAADGETDFLNRMWRDLHDTGQNPKDISSIILICDELKRRGQLASRHP